MTPVETGARDTGSRECAFCHHHYINPCDDVRKATCQNWLHLQEQPTKKAKKAKPKIKRVKLNKGA